VVPSKNLVVGDERGLAEGERLNRNADEKQPVRLTRHPQARETSLRTPQRTPERFLGQGSPGVRFSLASHDCCGSHQPRSLRSLRLRVPTYMAWKAVGFSGFL